MMLKKALLLFSILLFSGCVERGFELTVNETTNTITAVKSVEIRKKKTVNTAKDIDRMNKAVSNEHKKQTNNKTSEKSKSIKEEEEKAALERKIAKEKQIAFEKQKAENKRKLEEEKKAVAKKLRLEREAAVEKAKEKKAVKTAEVLNFKPSTQTYQKFGTSEIHGHVVYLTPSGQEITLKNTKIYLVPQNTTTDYWYNNYYLKNKESASISRTTVHYINATHLNLEKNFAFYGLATGTYYVIIESSYPSSIAKDKKVYIAKKINVEKYKKIMTVFSKKL